MGYAKERGKLEKLLTKTNGIGTFDEQNLKVLNDIHEQYSHTVRILKNKEPETFLELYTNELQQVKAGKVALRDSESDEARGENFDAYKNIVSAALEATIEAIKKTV